MTSAGAGNFFEDFRAGQILHHAPPRTLGEGDQALYTALYGARFATQSSAEFARGLGLPHSPIDDLLVFHTVFGKTVPEVSLNAIANLGYADCRFLKPVFAGDTLSAKTEVLGTRENANRESGIVYVRSNGFNQRGEMVLTYARWVMVRKRAKDAAVPPAHVPDLPKAVTPDALHLFAPEALPRLQRGETGGARFFDDYEAGQRFDHADGMTVEDAEHMMATRLYHNTARVHFNAHTEAKGRFGKRIVYGGHVISVARALSYNGFESALFVAGINAGRHVSPCFAGDTIYSWSQVVEKAAHHARKDWGFLRLRTLAAKDRACADFPDKTADGSYDPSILLDLDYWVVVPRVTNA
ncbi:MAG: MaoC family dehydratase [Alphaproteobacteria bacterium]|nr:MaoC family dehydratase [Alphaproteobacteria bacterium]